MSAKIAFNHNQVQHQTSLLRRLIYLTLLGAVLASALVYPMRIPNIYLARLDALADAHRNTWGNIYFGQLRSIIAFNHSPLALKETVSSSFIIASLCFLTLYSLRTISLQYVYNNQVACGYCRAGVLRWVRNPLVWGGAFLLYATLSAVLWSPTPHVSLRTLVLCALGIGAFATVVAIRPRCDELQKYMVSVALAGTLIAWISFLQHVDAAWWFLPKFDDPRNRIGSLIGHNTGLSAYLLFPLAFSLSFFFVARRRVTRVVLSLAILLILFVLVAAQSRAIWPIGTFMLLGQTVLLLRLHERRFSRVAVLGTILALLLALAVVQTVAPEVNPLARHTVRIVERLERDLNPRQLIKETRLRILVVSLPLIAKSPLIGHGLGSFQFVYPPAHGEYFARHPDSVLGTTVRRTDVAHNDYLQLLVETGLVGVVLLGGAIVLIFRTLTKGAARLPGKYEKTLFIGLLAPCCAMAIHAFVDFPFHIHPLALTAVVSLAFAYSAALQAQMSALAAPAMNESSLAHTAAAPDSLSPGGGDRAGLRLPMVAALVAVGSMWLASPLAMEFILREFISDTLYSDATNWVATARALGATPGMAKYQALDSAKELYRRAIKVNVFNGLAMEGMASACLLTGTYDTALWQEIISEGKNPRAAEQVRQTASRNLKTAIEYAKLAIEKGELRYHYLYYVLGQANNLLAKLYPEVSEYREAARRAFEQAIAFNNADVGSLQELADLYETMSPPDFQRAHALRHRIFEVDPDFGAQRYLAPVEEAAKRGRFVQAWQSLNKISEAVGEHWSVQFAKAKLYLREAVWPPPALDLAPSSPEARRWFEGRYSLAKDISKQLEATQGQNPLFQRFKLYLLAAGGETTSALELADKLLASTEVRDPELDVLRFELAQRIGKSVSLRWVESGSAEFWYYRQRLRTILLGPVSLGSVQLANMLLADPNTPLQLDDGLRAAAYLKAAQQWKLLEVLARKLEQLYPSEPDVRKLLKDIEDKAHNRNDIK